MADWFTSLTSTMQLLWGCAIVATIIFVIQNALMLMGIGDMDADTDVDMDVDAHEGTLGSAGVFSLFSLRNFINFFLGFGWGGISLSGTIENTTLLLLCSVGCGLLFVAVFVVLMRAVLRLESNGSFRINDCVGLIASVYLRIPANHAAAGKVQVSVHGSVHELDAFTDADEMLPTGTRVRITQVIDKGSLLVEKA